MTPMDIYPLGLSSFRLKGKKATLVTDPFDEKIVGLKYPRNVEADIITVSHQHPDHNVISHIGGSPVVFSGPGEYEARGIDVLGVATHHDDKNGVERGVNTVYKIEMDGLRIVHMGDIGHVLTEEQSELLDEVDILLLPVGGTYTVDAKKAAEIVTLLEPSLVIPMHYQKLGLNQQTFGALGEVDLFLKEMGKETVVPQSSLKITKDSLPPELQVVVLE